MAEQQSCATCAHAERAGEAHGYVTVTCGIKSGIPSLPYGFLGLENYGRHCANWQDVAVPNGALADVQQAYAEMVEGQQ